MSKTLREEYSKSKELIMAVETAVSLQIMPEMNFNIFSKDFDVEHEQAGLNSDKKLCLLTMVTVVIPDIQKSLSI